MHGNCARKARNPSGTTKMQGNEGGFPLIDFMLQWLWRLLFSTQLSALFICLLCLDKFMSQFIAQKVLFLNCWILRPKTFDLIQKQAN